MVIGPSDVVGGNYDVLIVDEAHRLKRRVNITNYKSFDYANKSLGLDNNGTELDWIIRSSRYQVLFYDKEQSIKPSDVKPKDFDNLDARPFFLKSQKRVKGGEEYIQFIEDLLLSLGPACKSFKDYDFKIYDHVNEMISDIKDKNEKYKLGRVVAGYAWDWKTRNGTALYDIEIDGLKLIWNRTNSDWVNSPTAIDEIGCIHTIQGYDLNYAGVIIGPELSYEPLERKIVINKDKYKDINGRRSIDDPKELEKYILNIYKTLLTRGIMGTYVFVVDDNLRQYFKTKIVE